MKDDLLELNEIQEKIKSKKIQWTKHCLNRLNQRDILRNDVKTAINEGEIIEYYYEDYPYPSCLISGNNLHIVCGVNEENVIMITAYYPDTDKWERDMKTRRKE